MVEQLTQTVAGAHLIRELHLLKQSIFPTKAWEPWICKNSFRGVKAFGHSSETNHAHDHDAHHQHWDSCPYQATLAVAAGSFLGQSYVTGMRLSSIGPAGDDVCVGVEASGQRETCLMMSVMFAPYTGRMYVKYAGNGPEMQAQVLPQLSDSDIAVNAWLEVTEKGAVRFLRQADGCPMESTGCLPPEFFPTWIHSFFASISFWCYDMAAKQLNVSVEWCSSAFPSELSVSAPCTEMDAVWKLILEDGYVQSVSAATH